MDLWFPLEVQQRNTISKRRVSSNCEECTCASPTHKTQPGLACKRTWQVRLSSGIIPGKQSICMRMNRRVSAHTWVCFSACCTKHMRFHPFLKLKSHSALLRTPDIKQQILVKSTSGQIHCHWCNSLEVHGITPGRKRLAV